MRSDLSWYLHIVWWQSADDHRMLLNGNGNGNNTCTWAWNDVGKIYRYSHAYTNGYGHVVLMRVMVVVVIRVVADWLGRCRRKINFEV